MKTRALLIPAVLTLALTAATSGGWATITLEDLPEYLVAGQPTELRFTVRQHGAERMSDLRPTVSASAGKRQVQVQAASRGKGVYAATITVPSDAAWTVTIKSNFGNSETTLLPIHAIARGTQLKSAGAPPALRGKQLFVAKGCLVCHVHASVANSGKAPMGPELTDQRFAEAYLRQFLADPSIKGTPINKQMPNLDLKPAEIAALSAFINAGGIAVK